MTEAAQPRRPHQTDRMSRSPPAAMMVMPPPMMMVAPLEPSVMMAMTAMMPPMAVSMTVSVAPDLDDSRVRRAEGARCRHRHRRRRQGRGQRQSTGGKPDQQKPFHGASPPLNSPYGDKRKSFDGTSGSMAFCGRSLTGRPAAPRPAPEASGPEARCPAREATGRGTRTPGILARPLCRAGPLQVSSPK